LEREEEEKNWEVEEVKTQWSRWRGGELLLLALLRILVTCGRVAGRRLGCAARRARVVVVVVVVLKVVVVVKLVVGPERGRVLLVAERLAGEEVDRARDDALLEVLADLVVELEALLDVFVDVLVVVVLGRQLGWAEEGEERLGRDDLFDDARLVRVLVALLLGLDARGRVLAFLPLDLCADGVVIDKVALVANLVLVVVRLVERRAAVGEKVAGALGAKVEDELEARLVVGGVLDLDVDEVLEDVLVALRDQVRDPDVVLEPSSSRLCFLCEVTA